MEINEVRWGPALVLELKGKLDVNTGSVAQAKLLSLIDQGYINLALDLSHLEYISSAGLRVLLSTLKKLKDCHGKIVLCPVRMRYVDDQNGVAPSFYPTVPVTSA